MKDGEDTQETRLSKHSITGIRINSKRQQQHAQGLHIFVPKEALALREEVDTGPVSVTECVSN